MGILGVFEAYYIVSAPAGPQNRPKTPTEAKKRVLVITLARGGVTGRHFGSQMVWDPQNPEISLLDPPMDPLLAHFVCKKAKFGAKIAFFSNMYFRTK